MQIPEFSLRFLFFLHSINLPQVSGNTAHTRMKPKFIAIIACSTLTMTSCASIFCGSKAKVTFDSDIEGSATLTIDGRKHTHVTFPYTTKIRRGFDETVVKAEAPNYKAEPIIINKSFNAVSVINLVNVLGWGIDAATGAITKPEFKFYQIDFQPKSPKQENTAE